MERKALDIIVHFCFSRPGDVTQNKNRVHLTECAHAYQFSSMICNAHVQAARFRAKDIRREGIKGYLRNLCTGVYMTCTQRLDNGYSFSTARTNQALHLTPKVAGSPQSSNFKPRYTT
jgi:hypothetical protein